VNLKTWGPITVLLIALALAVVVGGLVVVIVNPSQLTFEQYLTDLRGFAISLGILGIGRGIHLAATSPPTASTSSSAPALSDEEELASIPTLAVNVAVPPDIPESATRPDVPPPSEPPAPVPGASA
jgi:hypothetical protein